MTCPIASREDYDLWYLGLLEGPLAEEISSHVRAGCPACTQAVRSCAYLWATVAYTQSTESTVLPSRALRAGILRNALRTQPQRRWSQRWSLRWSWDAWPRWMVPAFSAAAVLLMAIVLFQPGRRAEVPDAHMREIARLQAEVAQWRERAQAAVPPQVQAAPAQAMRTDTPQQPPPPPLPARRDPALEMELANARQQAGAASDALTAERARTAKLQSETDSLRAMASAASAQKDEAERKLNAAIGDPGLAEKDRQLSTLTTQVRQLELENATYRETVLRLERQVN